MRTVCAVTCPAAIFKMLSPPEKHELQPRLSMCAPVVFSSNWLQESVCHGSHVNMLIKNPFRSGSASCVLNCTPPTKKVNNGWTTV